MPSIPTHVTHVALVGLVLSGCIIDAQEADVANITAQWSLRDLGDLNHPTACPVGFTTAALVSQRVDVEGRPVDDLVTDLFPCDDSFGITDRLAADRQRVWLEIRSDDGGRRYASSTSAYVDLGGGSATFEAVILNDGGYFQLAWNLVGQQSNQPLTCNEVVGGVGAVTTVATNAENSVMDTFACEDHGGVSSGLLAGPYTVSLAAAHHTTLFATAILDRNAVTDLGSITIPIEGQ
ncbi:MAG: hypothetical protein NT062_30525 [Proteobacteria bacterium]|nr:hypothetical protein [Pseudomonadota bacterium]